MKILVIAPPRSGTGYASKCLQNIGLDVGHERLGENGISSWLWAVNCYDNARWGDNYRHIDPDVTIMLLRRPEDIIASLAFTASRALDWMGQFIEIKGNDILEKAAQAVSGWNKKCLERKPDYLLTLDDFPYFCKEEFGNFPDEELKGYNTRKHRCLSQLELDSIAEYLAEIRITREEYARSA